MKVKTTHCRHGHERTPENIYVAPKTGVVGCRICRRKARRKVPYGSNLEWLFGGNREIAIKRDGEKCVMCGMTREEHRQRYKFDITVDHIDGNGSHTPKEKKNNSLDNLQTLCLSCHARKDNRFMKLTDEQVINIRHIGDAESQAWIAKQYGVKQRNISYILARKTRTNI